MNPIVQTLAQATTSTNPLVSALPIIALMAIFWFVLIVPQRRQAKAHEALTAALQKGDQVVTAGGLIGEIISLRDDQITLRTGSATVVVERARIARRLGPAAAEK
ncbi:MAG TPA: preprotein translocase subunit YajC [Longimicrobium sp.]|nr:preprotein translocase subunit YajC [Longimicrobium sp.]